MIRTLSEDKERAFFDQHSKIVHGVLKKLNVSWRHADYDDFVQQGLLKLVEAYETFPEDLEQEEFLYQFTGFAYTKVRWHMLDLLRKQQRKWEREMPWPEHLESNRPDTQVPFEQAYQEMDLLKEMLPLLTKNEQAYLLDAVVNQLSVTEIAKKQAVSRKTVYQWKKRVAEKLNHFLLILKN
ncbi:sigma-70 family RNA polymerase sigma factor [Carnobacterium pleistocenium]|uniref:sigma-70 family RNA polymerase sigma factor n=1 Tax=Carnobacterium pleistocenium TaxID=181073 RepID=UPI000559233F|nr:sigma-70 family RNA polymerase sigma factor [Carnobacterium pleistocenium]